MLKLKRNFKRSEKSTIVNVFVLIPSSFCPEMNLCMIYMYCIIAASAKLRLVMPLSFLMISGMESVLFPPEMGEREGGFRLPIPGRGGGWGVQSSFLGYQSLEGEGGESIPHFRLPIPEGGGEFSPHFLVNIHRERGVQSSFSYVTNTLVGGGGSLSSICSHKLHEVLIMGVADSEEITTFMRSNSLVVSKPAPDHRMIHTIVSGIVICKSSKMTSCGVWKNLFLIFRLPISGGGGGGGFFFWG
jgi:hypothetical protein